jgi:hypothetical protein
MAIFKLKRNNGNIIDAELVEATKKDLDLEKHLECWIEKSPWAIAQEPLIWIGRQTTASQEDSIIFPDLIGMDRDGNIVVVELKKGRAPREVIAQILEYATWVSSLTDKEIISMATTYISQNQNIGKTRFDKLFIDKFEVDDFPSINQTQRLFIIAEEIPPRIASVCRFLRTSHGLDIHCIEFSVFETESGEMLVNSERIVGQEEVIEPKKKVGNRWSGDIPVRQVVWEAVQKLTNYDPNYIFSPKEVTQVVLKKFPNFNKSTVGCQIISDCVGHTSRHHYPGGEDRYWWVDKGKYRLYDPKNDKNFKNDGTYR